MNTHTWIFVSHASADLGVVRQVRNYLESLGTSPLLFHLLSLRDPEEFWPLIEREIQERNFFLYCESASAEESVWVRREREAVDAARRNHAKRIGTIRVDGPSLDFSVLDELVTKTRVFPSYAYSDAAIVRPYIRELRLAGFSVFDAPDSLSPEADWQAETENEIEAASKDGWVLVFLSTRSLASKWVSHEINRARLLGARLLPVIIDPQMGHTPALAASNPFDGTVDPSNAPVRLVNELLNR